MQHFVAALGLLAVAMAAPAPEVARAVKARQVGGGLGGFIPGASGFVAGTIPANGLPFGCIGGAIDNEGFTICARGARQTPAPLAPEVARAVKARQIGGGLGGFIPGASGFLSGNIPASGLPFGCIGGSIDGFGATVCARDAAAPTPAPEVARAVAGRRQVGGGLGGFVPSASGFLSGTVPASGLPFGCIGGGILGPEGITICAREAEATPAPVVERQIGGGLGGFVPGAEGTITGDIPANAAPTGFLSGSALGTSATLAGRQIGGGFGGFVPGAEGTATGDVPANGLPTGLIGGIAGGLGATLVGRAEPTPTESGEAEPYSTKKPGVFDTGSKCHGYEIAQAGVTACIPGRRHKRRGEW